MKKLALVLSLLTCLSVAGFGAGLPRPAGDLTVYLPGGKQAKVSDYKGQPLIVMLFLTTCPHCQNCARILSGIEKDLAPKGLKVLAGAMNEGADTAAFVRDYATPFPVGSVNQMAALAYMQLAPDTRTFVPWVLFIDRKGMVQAQYTGGDDFLKDELKEDANIRAEAMKLLGGAGAAKKTVSKK